MDQTSEMKRIMDSVDADPALVDLLNEMERRLIEQGRTIILTLGENADLLLDIVMCQIAAPPSNAPTR